jgi:hypothetical protein
MNAYVCSAMDSRTTITSSAGGIGRLSRPMIPVPLKSFEAPPVFCTAPRQWGIGKSDIRAAFDDSRRQAEYSRGRACRLCRQQRGKGRSCTDGRGIRWVRRPSIMDEPSLRQCRHPGRGLPNTDYDQQASLVEAGYQTLGGFRISWQYQCWAKDLGFTSPSSRTSASILETTWARSRPPCPRGGESGVFRRIFPETPGGFPSRTVKTSRSGSEAADSGLSGIASA